MATKFYKKFKNFILTSPLIFLASLFPVKFANGVLIEFFGLTALSLMIGTVLYILGYIGSLLVTLGGGLTQWALNLNNALMTTKAVGIGWVISRDIANLGFVLAIIIIAFTTILRWETYETKKLLTRLIIAALLVNFSLLIAGAFIDFSGVITNFFINEASSGNPGQLRDNLMNAFKIQSAFEPVKNTGTLDTIFKGLKDSLNASISFITSLFFVVIFTFAAAVVLLGLAFMFFIRYIALALLLITMPLAFLFWIIPDLQHLWSKWWSSFFRWVFFTPAASFFVYLALKIPEGTASENQLTGINSLLNPGNAPLATENFATMLAQMILVIGILVGGLIVSDKMGIHGASAAMSLGGKFKNKAIGASGRLVGGGFNRALRAGYQAPDPKTGLGGGNIIQRASQKWAGTPVVGGVARAVNTGAASSGQKQIEDFKKELSGLDRVALASAADGFKMRDPAYAAAYAEVAADKGLLKDLKEKNPVALEKMVTAARTMGTEGALLSKDPTLAKVGEADKNIGRSKTGIAVKKMKISAVTELSKDALSDADVALNFSPRHIEEIFKKGSIDQEMALRKTYSEYKAALPAQEGEEPITWENLSAGLKLQYNNTAADWESAVNSAKANLDGLAPEIKLEYEKNIASLSRSFAENIAAQASQTPRGRKGRETTGSAEAKPKIIIASKYEAVKPA